MAARVFACETEWKSNRPSWAAGCLFRALPTIRQGATILEGLTPGASGVAPYNRNPDAFGGVLSSLFYR